MDERIEQIKIRLAEATPGPWEIDGGDGICYLHGPRSVDDSFIRTDLRRDAEFVASAPGDIAYLLAKVERLEAAQIARAALVEQG